MNAINLGNPNLFVKGVAEQIFYDPATGNIVGYDNVASEAAITTSVNLQNIEGGMGNALVGVIPDTTRVTGTYTSQAFSLETRRLITGGALSYGGISPVCEEITASGATLTVTNTPAKHYAQPSSDTNCWCYVKEKDATTYAGTNYSVSPTTKQVVDFIATSGTVYQVFYFVSNVSARVLAIPDNFNPTMVSVQTKYGVYAKQNNSVSQGTLQGYLYVVVPNAILNGDAGLNANQTSNATTDGSWMAISPDNTMMTCAECGSTGNNLMYYIYVPCGDGSGSIDGIAVVGGYVDLYWANGGYSEESKPVQAPLKWVLADGSVVQPDFTKMTYTATPGYIGSEDSGQSWSLSVSSNGVISASYPDGNNLGDGTITAKLTANPSISCTFSVIPHQS